MSRSAKILASWIVISLLLVASLFLLPSKMNSGVSLLNTLIQLLLFVISIYLVRVEPTSKNKFIFVNFALLFSLSVVFHLYSFIGPGLLLFADNPFARLYFNQYISLGGYFFLMALAIVYVTVDALFRDFKTFQKYLIALAIVGGFFGYYYSPFFTDPKHAHHTADILDWKTIEKVYSSYQSEHGVAPTPEQIAERTEIYTWANGVKSGVLYPEAALQRIQQLYPYLEGDNYIILVYRPLYLNAISMCVLCLGFILLYFGYQYMKDPPQGAYIEKIMFLFLVFCSMEILHAWSLLKSIEWLAFANIMQAGQYVSIVILLFIAMFFGLRLRFITSVKGEFYEQELALSPGAVTRWRDSLDNIVIEKFFNRKMVLGRLFVGTPRK